MSGRTWVRGRDGGRGKSGARPKVRCTVEPLERRALLSGVPVPIALTNFAVGGTQSSNPTNLTVFNGSLYFVADDGTHGPELWRTDGTPGGTALVKDIASGAPGSSPDGLAVAGNTLFFTADDGVHGRELWKTDGTSAGTTLVKDIDPTASGSDIGQIVPVGNAVYFLANDHTGPNRQRLWRSDGTAAGTFVVSDTLNYTYTSVGGLAAFNGLLFFTAADATHGVELWKTDGTPSGTSMVADVNPAGDANPYELFAAANAVYFWATDGTHGYQLFKADGTAAGATLVKDVHPGGIAGALGYFTALGGKVYFVASDAAHGTELWRTDGTDAGTAMVKDVLPGTGSSYPTGLTAFNGAIYFRADDGVNGEELWRSDGTDVGTSLFKDIEPGPLDSSVTNLVAVGSTLYFRVESDTPGAGAQLWSSDGTPGGTAAIPGVTIQSEDPGVAFNGSLFFPGYDAAHGGELWSSGGTSAAVVADVNPSATDRTFSAAAAFNGAYLFVVDDGVHGSELWRSDGTPGGTSLLKDIMPGAGGSSPHLLGFAGGLLYFRATDSQGAALWTTDGTPAGTARASSSLPSVTPVPTPGSSVTLFGAQYYQAHDVPHGYELWTSAGTPAVASLVADLNPGSADAFIQGLVVSGGRVFFSAYDDVSGRQLYALSPAPVAAPTVQLAGGSDTGASQTDRVTQAGMPTFTGTADPLTTVRLLIDGSLAATSTSDANGHWTATVSQLLAEGTHSVAAYETAPGGAGPVSAALAIVVDRTAPAASLMPVATPTGYAASIDFTVMYTDAVGMDAGSVGDDDVTVSGPNGFTASATKVSAMASDGGKTVAAVYRLTRPGGFVAAANGTYTVSQAAGAVKDAAGNAAAAGTLGSFVVNVPADAAPPDTTPPTAAVQSFGTPVLDADHWDVTLVLSDDSGIDAASVGNGGVIVTGPNGFSVTGTLVSFTPSGKGGTAVFRVAAPGGFFDLADNGAYTVSVPAGAFADTSGNSNAAASFGPFTVDLVAPALTADLGGTITAAPATVLPGSKGNAVTLKLVNVGTRPFGGKVTVRLYAMPADNVAFDPAAAVSLGSAVVSVIVAAKGSATAKVAFNAPAAIAEGDYRVVAVLDPGRVAELYKSNNTLVASKTTRFVAPAADLAVTFKKAPASVGKKKAAVLVTVTNKGNATAVGPATVALYASDDQALDLGLDALLSKGTQKLSLKPGKSVTFSLTAISAGGLAGTSKYLAAAVTYTGKPADPNPGNDSVFSKTMVKFT